MVIRLGGANNLALQCAVTAFLARTFTRSLHYHTGRGTAALWREKKAGFTVSFDVDYREDVLALPALVDFLSEHSVKASFAVVGRWVEAYPEEHKRVVVCGHEVVNHTYTHPDNEELSPGRFFDRLSAGEKKDEILRCDRAIERVMGVKAKGFRAPHFGNVSMRGVYALLRDLGYVFSSSVTAPRGADLGAPALTPEGIMEIPVSTCPRHPFSALDTWHAFRKPGGGLRHGAWHTKAGEFAVLIEELVAIALAYGSYGNLYFDPRDVVGAAGVGRIIPEIGRKHVNDLCMIDYGGFKARTIRN
jgi:hypothetical protein